MYQTISARKSLLPLDMQINLNKKAARLAQAKRQNLVIDISASE